MRPTDLAADLKGLSFDLQAFAAEHEYAETSEASVNAHKSMNLLGGVVAQAAATAATEP